MNLFKLNRTISRKFGTANKNLVYNFEDPLNFKTLLTESEIEIMEASRSCFQSELMPGIIEANRHHKFDKNIYKVLGSQGYLGCTLNDYGGAGVSQVAYGLINREIERVDSGYRSAFSVQNSLVIFPIHAYGTKEIKDKYLPDLISGNIIGCFGLTEPDAGSDPSSMKSTAKLQPDGSWILNGTKTWITNSVGLVGFPELLRNSSGFEAMQLPLCS